MQRGSASQRSVIQAAIETGAVDMLEEVITIVKETGALDFSRRAAGLEAQRAIAAAQRLPQGPHASCLIQLADQLLGRDN
jgi:octaprenyl-diphosphate synthase